MSPGLTAPMAPLPLPVRVSARSDAAWRAPSPGCGPFQYHHWDGTHGWVVPSDSLGQSCPRSAELGAACS